MQEWIETRRGHASRCTRWKESTSLIWANPLEQIAMDKQNIIKHVESVPNMGDHFVMSEPNELEITQRPMNHRGLRFS